MASDGESKNQKVTVGVSAPFLLLGEKDPMCRDHSYIYARNLGCARNWSLAVFLGTFWLSGHDSFVFPFDNPLRGSCFPRCYLFWSKPQIWLISVVIMLFQNLHRTLHVTWPYMFFLCLSNLIINPLRGSCFPGCYVLWSEFKFNGNYVVSNP